MAVRTTAAEVLAIMDNCQVSESDVTTYYISVATLLVDDILGDDTVLGDTMKAAIEQWLTAHLIAVSRSRTTTEEKVGDASLKYTGRFGEGLKSTPYGQMVLTLDSTGKMAKSGQRGASIYAITSFD